MQIIRMFGGFLVLVAIWWAVEAIGLVAEGVAELMDAIGKGVQAIGGAETLVTIGGGGLLVWIVGGYLLGRAREARKARAMPGEVAVLVLEAADEYARGAMALKQAIAEVEAQRAPLFWDQIQECDAAAEACSKRLVEAKELREQYRKLARRHGLEEAPPEAAIPEQAATDTLNLLDAVAATARESLAIPAFAMVYEQRRAASMMVDMQAQAHDEIRAGLQTVLEVSGAAASSAAAAATAARDAQRASKDARRASERAAGDWF